MTTPDELARYAATEIDAPPMYFGTIPVRGRKKSYAAVLWAGTEWLVSEFGLEKRNGEFRIPTSRLWYDEAGIGWIHAMSALDDVTDLTDFAEGLRLARGVDAGKLDRRALRPKFAAVG